MDLVEEIVKYVSSVQLDYEFLPIIREYYELKRSIENLKEENKRISRRKTTNYKKKRKENVDYSFNIERIAEIEEILKRIESALKAKEEASNLREKRQSIIETESPNPQREFLLGLIDDEIKALEDKYNSEEEVSEYENLTYELRRLNKEQARIEENRRKGYDNKDKAQENLRKINSNIELIKRYENRLRELLEILKNKPEVLNSIETIAKRNEHVSEEYYYETEELFRKKLKDIDDSWNELDFNVLETMTKGNIVISTIYNELKQIKGSIKNSMEADKFLYKLYSLQNMTDLNEPKKVEISPELTSLLEEIEEERANIDFDILESMAEKSYFIGSLYKYIVENKDSILDVKSAKEYLTRIQMLTNIFEMSNVKVEKNEDKKLPDRVYELDRIINKINVSKILDKISNKIEYADYYPRLKELYSSLSNLNDLKNEKDIKKYIEIAEEIIALIDNINLRKLNVSYLNQDNHNEEDDIYIRDSKDIKEMDILDYDSSYKRYVVKFTDTDGKNYVSVVENDSKLLESIANFLKEMGAYGKSVDSSNANTYVQKVNPTEESITSALDKCIAMNQLYYRFKEYVLFTEITSASKADDNLMKKLENNRRVLEKVELLVIAQTKYINSLSNALWSKDSNPNFKYDGDNPIVLMFNQLNDNMTEDELNTNRLKARLVVNKLVPNNYKMGTFSVDDMLSSIYGENAMKFIKNKYSKQVYSNSVSK